MNNQQHAMTKKRILLTARKAFFTYGFSKVTMDELASDLHMSKKTLYYFFQSKQLLLEAVILDFFQEFQKKVHQIMVHKRVSGSDILKKFMTLVQSQLSQLNVKAFEDIRKSNPRTWQKIMQYREKMINNELRKIIQKGIKEGIIRPDIDLDIIVLVILNTIQSIAVPEVFSQFSYSNKDIIEMIAKIVMGGIINQDTA